MPKPLRIALLAIAALVLAGTSPVVAQTVPDPPDRGEELLPDTVAAAGYDYYTFDSCRNDFGGGEEPKYRNHFASCLVVDGTYPHLECGQSGCVPTGLYRFRFTQIGFGSRTSQTMRFQAALDDWSSEGSVDAGDDFTLRFTCTDFKDDDVCVNSHPDPQTRTIGQWMADGVLPEVVLDTSGSVGGGDLVHRDADKVNYHQLHTFSWGEGPGRGELIAPFRCDAAPYLGGGACLFHNVDAVHHVSLLPEDGVQDEALHILLAQTVPEATKPGTPGKSIPGSIESGAPLTRLYPGYDDNGQYNRNHDVAVATCRQFWGADYARGPDGPRDCDEYPYRSTFEGAYRSVLFPDAPWSYSAWPIASAQNQKAGRELGAWYLSDHILHGDKFFVKVTGCDGCGGEPPPPPPPGNTPPTVDAGPDATGDEGGAVTLSGTVTDPDDTPSVAWSYQPGPDVDPGTVCQFGNAGQVSTTITCTDDGTVTVTLTADDSHGPPSPVSDTATVQVSNVAPEMALSGPQPWQVFRAGDPVEVGATFTDPGSNDTHTCAVDWDDGQPATSAPAENHGCLVTRTFDDAGMYTIGLTVTDDDGASDTAEVMVVVYDPSAGLVTSTGFLPSPPGALTSDPDATGLAPFVFAAKYLFQDDTRPLGTALDVVLPLTTFSFVSLDLEWLVITPDAKVAIKGTGAVDGEGGYGFVLYAEATKLRLVVWPLDQGPIPTGQPLYDNRPTAGYDVDVAEPQQIILGVTIIDTGFIPGLPALPLLSPES